MKKYFVFIITLVVTTLIVLADDARFMNALKNCSAYSESGTINTENMNVTSQKQILGWDGDRCVYRDKIQFSGIDSCVTCKLSRAQIDEIVSVMQAYAVVQKYSQDNVDTSSVAAVQNNPVVKVWNKYLQDSSVCTMSALQLQAQ